MAKETLIDKLTAAEPAKHGRDLLVGLGWAARWNGLNFLTQTGFAVVDSLWGLEHFVKP